MFRKLLLLAFFNSPWMQGVAQESEELPQIQRASDRTVLMVTHRKTGEMDIFLKGQFVKCSTNEEKDFMHKGVIDSIGRGFLMIGSKKITLGSLASITRKRDDGHQKRLSYKSTPYGAVAYGITSQHVKTGENSYLGKSAAPVLAGVGLAIQGIQALIRAQAAKSTRVFWMSEYRIRTVTYSYE